MTPPSQARRVQITGALMGVYNTLLQEEPEGMRTYPGRVLGLLIAAMVDRFLTDEGL